MKGFITDNGYMGLINGEYMLFASESDYFDYFYNQYDEEDDWGLAA